MTEGSGDAPKGGREASDAEDGNVTVDPARSSSADASLEEHQRRRQAVRELLKGRIERISPTMTTRYRSNVDVLDSTPSDLNGGEATTDQVVVSDEDIYFELAASYFERTTRVAEQSLSGIAALIESLNQEVETKWG